MPEYGQEVDQPISILSEVGLPYVWIPYLILDMYGPAMKEKGWLYTVLTRFKNSKDSSTFVGVRTLAAACGIHRDTVQEWAKHLQNIGLIRIVPGDHSHPTQYTLLMPPMPPPPEILSNHYPDDWEPPKRALKALENVRFHLGDYGRPQETLSSNGGVLSGRTGVLENGTDRPKPTIKVSHPVGHNNTLNKSSNNKTNKPETHPLVSSLFEKFKLKSPDTTYATIEEAYHKALNLSKDDESKALEMLENAIAVVHQTKDLTDPEGLFWKAIENGWKPRPFKGSPEIAPGPDLKKIEKDREERERKEFLNAPVEQIISNYDFLKKHDKRNDPLETIKKTYQDNKNLEKAVQEITKGGDKSGS